MIFYGSAAEHLKRDGYSVTTSRFPDGEVGVFIGEDVENKRVIYIQSTCRPVNDNLLELLITINAFKQKFADKVTVVIPYFGYCRQDRLDENCSSISAKVVANLIGSAGIDKLIVIDLHTPQLTGFFPMPVLHLSANPLFAQFIKNNFNLNEIVIVSPDVGGLKRANELADLLSVDVAIIDKKRYGPRESEPGYVVGNVDGKICILVDDMIDSGTTLIKAALKLQQHGGRTIYCMATHALLSGNALEDLQNSNIEKILVTNTIYQATLPSKFTVFNITDLLSSVIS